MPDSLFILLKDSILHATELEKLKNAAIVEYYNSMISVWLGPIMGLILFLGVGWAYIQWKRSGDDIQDWLIDEPTTKFGQIAFFTTILECLNFMLNSMEQGEPFLSAFTRYATLGILEVILAFLFAKKVNNMVQSLLNGSKDNLNKAITDGKVKTKYEAGLFLDSYVGYKKIFNGIRRNPGIIFFFVLSLMATWVIDLCYRESVGVIRFLDHGGLLPWFGIESGIASGHVSIAAKIMIWSTPFLSLLLVALSVIDEKDDIVEACFKVDVKKPSSQAGSEHAASSNGGGAQGKGPLPDPVMAQVDALCKEIRKENPIFEDIEIMSLAQSKREAAKLALQANDKDQAKNILLEAFKETYNKNIVATPPKNQDMFDIGLFEVFWKHATDLNLHALIAATEPGYLKPRIRYVIRKGVEANAKWKEMVQLGNFASNAFAARGLALHIGAILMEDQSAHVNVAKLMDYIWDQNAHLSGFTWKDWENLSTEARAKTVTYVKSLPKDMAENQFCQKVAAYLQPRSSNSMSRGNGPSTEEKDQILDNWLEDQFNFNLTKIQLDAHADGLFYPVYDGANGARTRDLSKKGEAMGFSDFKQTLKSIFFSKDRNELQKLTEIKSVMKKYLISFG